MQTAIVNVAGDANYHQGKTYARGLVAAVVLGVIACRQAPQEIKNYALVMIA